VLHVRRVPLCAVKSCNLDGAYGVSGVKKDEIVGKLFIRGRFVELDVEQIVPHRLDMGIVLNI